MAMLPVGPSNFSKIQIGDYVAKAGLYTQPGVVIEKNEDGTVVVDTDPTQIQQYHRHANTSGLSPEEKDSFNGIMDQIMDSQDSGERINMLQQQIDVLGADGGNRKVVSSLRNQQAELIRYARELPRVYKFDGEKVRI
jgi:hypothetical protein